MKKPTIGFIGQGWIGKNYAKDFENRGYSVVRYSLEPAYENNGDKIKDCDIVFIAVPTPSTPKGFDASIVASAVKKVGKGKIAVIKSTMFPGTTTTIQKQNPGIIVFHSPEFLTEATAAHDAAHPKRNIIGITIDNKKQRAAAQSVLSVLPKAPFELVCKVKEAELIKYAGNNWLYFKVIFVNLLYDLAVQNGCDYDIIREAISADPRIGSSHLVPIHKSGTLAHTTHSVISKKDRKKMEGGRGAGGHCFIKDFAAFVELYEVSHPKDALGLNVLKAIEKKNIQLLVDSEKDLDLLVGVYGNKVLAKRKKK